MAEPFLIIGHRGSPRSFPENTLASFDAAFRCGADGIETDLRLLHDGTAVLFHDDDLDESAIESLTYDQCTERGATIERLRDLERLAGRGLLVLEVKRPQWEEVLLEHVGEWDNVVIASFDHSMVVSLHERGCRAPLGITFSGFLVDVASYAARLGATWCFPQYRYVDRDTVSALHDRGIRIVPWTANRPADWQHLREIGCDGVITDLPCEAVAWRDGTRNE
jgi:glycerophosphoryl diester phosphodiesterase